MDEEIYCPICGRIGLNERRLFTGPLMNHKDCCHTWIEIAYYFAEELRDGQNSESKIQNSGEGKS